MLFIMMRFGDNRQHEGNRKRGTNTMQAYRIHACVKMLLKLKI